MHHPLREVGTKGTALTHNGSKALRELARRPQVLAVLSGHVTEAALGYFLNPLVTVALGVVVLRERLRRTQWVAVGIGTVAALYLTVDYGTPPWISLALAFSFASYSLLKNRLGISLSALRSLAGESLVILPVAVAILVWLAGRIAMFTVSTPVGAFLLDIAFMALLAGAVWREVIAGSNA